MKTTIAPSWFDPSTAPPQVTPFGLLYAIPDVQPQPCSAAARPGKVVHVLQHAGVHPEAARGRSARPRPPPTIRT